MIIKRVLFICIILIQFITNQNLCHAQSPIIDSLRNELYTTNNNVEKLDIQVYLAHYFAYINQDSAFHYSNNLIKQAKEINNFKYQFQGYIKYALSYFAYEDNTNLDSCYIYLDSAKLIAEENTFFYGLTRLYQFKAVINESLYEFDKAINNYLHTLNRALETNDSAMAAYCYYNLADIYFTSGDVSNALNTLNENDDYIQNLKKSGSLHLANRLKGVIFLKQNEYGKSITALKQALKSPGNFFNIRNIQELAYAYYKNGETDSANYYFNKTIALSVNNETATINNSYYKYLIDYLIDNKQYKKAAHYLEKSNDYTFINEELEILKSYIYYYKQTQQYDSAFVYINQLNTLSDSLNIKGLGHLINNTITEKKLIEIKNELTELQKAQVTSVKHNTLIILLFISSVLLLIVVWYIQFRTIKQYQGSLLNDAISGSFTDIFSDTLLSKKPILMATGVSTTIMVIFMVSFFKGLTTPFTFIYLISIAAILFFVCEKLFIAWAIKKTNTLKREIIAYLLLQFLSSILLALFSKLFISEITLQQSGFILLSTFSAFSLAHIFLLQLHFAQANNLISDRLIEKFNKKQATLAKTSTVNTQQSISLTVDNMGKDLDIDISTILYITSDNIYQEFICLNGDKTNKILVRNTLNNIEEKLGEYSNFTRCHRSYIINKSVVQSIEGNSRQYYFVLKNVSERIPISRSLAKDILADFNAAS